MVKYESTVHFVICLSFLCRYVHKVSSSHGQNTLVKMVNMAKLVNMNIPFLVSPAAFGT